MVDIIGYSKSLQALRVAISRVSASDCTVLIAGETGVGKDLVARSVHEESPRRAGPFVPVDCGTLSGTLVQSELFGHLEGAFTGASTARDGLLAAAHGGTLFLDEVGELPLDSQKSLLRVLQERTVRPLGASTHRAISIRVVAATNLDLERQVQIGRFREDLFYRLNVITLHVPPLRDRRDDIPALAAHFLRRYEPAGRKLSFSDAAQSVLFNYPWPGNVRELENCIHRAALFASGNTIRPGALQLKTAPIPAAKDAGAPNVRLLREIELEEILKAVHSAGGDRRKAASALGIGRSTLYRRLKEYGCGG